MRNTEFTFETSCLLNKKQRKRKTICETTDLMTVCHSQVIDKQFTYLFIYS